MGVYTTEIASDKIASDNPIHQRLLRPYEIVAEKELGELLEIGCGEGRGTELLIKKARSYTAIDKIQEVVDRLSEKYPEGTFMQKHIPPLAGIPDESFDTVVSFQVIEHIEDDRKYLEEIRRVLRPGGVAYITTPNIKQSLTRNPWHIREYTAEELSVLAVKIFSEVEMNGITGNEKVMAYHEQNRESVRKITRFDILNLQYRLPAWLLRKPYEVLNRMNRNKLKNSNDELVNSIVSSDYIQVEKADAALDLFMKVTRVKRHNWREGFAAK